MSPWLSLRGGSPSDPFEQIDLTSGARLLLQPDARLPKVHLRCVLQGGPSMS